MKIILTFILFCVPFFKVIAQDESQQKFVYEKVLTYENTSKEDLYKYSKRWVSSLFPNSNAALRTDDPASGEIIGMGLTEIIENPNALYGPRMSVEFTFMINVKDNKSRIRFYDLTQVTPMGSRQSVSSIDLEKQNAKERTKVKWEKFVSLIDAEFISLTDDFTSEIAKSIKDDF